MRTQSPHPGELPPDRTLLLHDRAATLLCDAVSRGTPISATSSVNGRCPAAGAFPLAARVGLHASRILKVSGPRGTRLARRDISADRHGRSRGARRRSPPRRDPATRSRRDVPEAARGVVEEVGRTRPGRCDAARGGGRVALCTVCVTLWTSRACRAGSSPHFSSMTGRGSARSARHESEPAGQGHMCRSEASHLTRAVVHI